MYLFTQLLLFTIILLIEIVILQSEIIYLLTFKIELL
nr:MAG TPA: hypothetical protein [Caudoviricetes sp.]